MESMKGIHVPVYPLYTVFKTIMFLYHKQSTTGDYMSEFSACHRGINCITTV